IELGGEAASIFDGAAVHLFLTTSAAQALLLRFAGAACVLAGLRARIRPPYPLALAGGVLMIGSFPLTGHSVAQPHRAALAALLLVHVAVVAFWFGALRPLRQAVALEPRTVASVVLASFSARAVWLVPVIALAGASLAALLLPDVEGLLRPYGLLLLAKVGLFALLMGLAARNRLRLAPALAAGSAGAPATLRRSIALEYALICVVLGVTAVMSGSFSPAPSHDSRQASLRTHDGAPHRRERCLLIEAHIIAIGFDPELPPQRGEVGRLRAGLHPRIELLQRAGANGGIPGT
ncbi:MAG: CopD family protein, partial [Gammaproteobacteria bacterium]|nr:CopD family protein [Gammaproteobacteria bacterium]